MSVAGFATLPLRFGDRTIEPGEPVPFEPGRNYRLMIRLGQMAPYRDVNAQPKRPAEDTPVPKVSAQESAQEVPKRPVGRPRKNPEE